MIPILYDYSETEWTSNGLGRLSDCLSCTVTEERNGIYECVFEYPITGIHYADIVEGRIVGVIHDDTKEIEPFDIYKCSAEINGIVTFSAHHVSYRLSYITLKPFTASSCAGTMASLPTNSINNNPFTFSTDKTTSGNYNLETPTAIREMLCGSQGSILDVYGTGEYEFKKFNVFLWTHRGQDSGVEVRYGKNMLDLTKDYDISGSYNAVAPFWYSADGTLITLPEEIIISPTIINTGSEPWTTESLVGMTDENGTQIDFDYAVINVVPMDLTAEFADVPTVEELRAKATSRLANSSAWLPDENLKIDFVALWQTEEYKNVAPLQRVSLCDTVSVFFPQMGVNAVKAKVIKTVYNVLLECYDKMELGNAQYSFAEVVSDTTATKLSRTMASKGFLTASLDRATKLIQGGLGGHVVFNTNADGEPQEILVMDTDDINTAVNVIRINRNGIGFSRDGYAGEYITAWTIDGHFVADFIDTGTLSANLLRAGTINSLDGSTSWNLNSGKFITTSGSQDTVIEGGSWKFLYNGETTLIAKPTYWNLRGGVEEKKRGSIIQVDKGGGFLTLGYRHATSSGGTASWPLIILNNGVNPFDYTHDVIFAGDVVFSTGTYHDGNIIIYPSSYGGALHNCIRFYMPDDAPSSTATEIYCDYENDCLRTNKRFRAPSILSNYIYLSDTVAYFYYNSSGDFIYSSKTIHQASDENLKNIAPYDDKYDDLLDVLEPVLYTWKSHPEGARYVGLGARKTAKLLKECGIENSGFVGINQDEDWNEIYSIDYNELSTMLLHKVQKQEKRIKELENTLNDVLERLKRLEA